MQPPPPYDITYPPPQRPEQRLWRWYRSLYPITQAGLGCLVLFVALFGCAFCMGGLPDLIHGIQQGYEQNQPPPIATDTPTQDTTPAPEWTITNTFPGNGTGHTATFTVTGDWQLNWYCTLLSSGMSQGNLSIDVDRPGQKTPLIPFAVDANCAPGASSGATEESQTGTLYLAVTSNTQWTIEIEQLL